MQRRADAPPPAGGPEGDLGELASDMEGEAGAVRPGERSQARGQAAASRARRTGDTSPNGRGRVKTKTAVGMVGRSEPFLDMLRQLHQAAEAGFGLRLLGERGTGKELAAREYAAHSPRARGPFVALNAGQVTPGLAESLLCGHERGAYTGAVASRIGVFERANGGTLFIDEVPELPLEVQPMMLRILQEREFCRVGGDRMIKVDVAVVVATNRDLQDLVMRDRFRADLFDRLALPPVRVPALRERGAEDIMLLADHFMREVVGQLDVQLQFTRSAARALTDHDWPGNVRELQNVVRCVAVRALRSKRVTESDVRRAISDCCARTEPSVARRARGPLIQDEHLTEVKRRLANGESASAIAASMDVSTKTIQRCRNR